jgi:hypothetical protein
MNMRNLRILCAVAIGLSGCAPLSQPPPLHTPRISPNPALYPMGPCTGGEPQPVRVVRIVIPSGFDPANVRRKVRYKVVTPRDDPDADDVNENGTPNALGGSSGPLDVNLTSISPVNGAYAEIRVVLKDTDYSFLNGTGVPGVELSSPGNPMGFCGARPGKNPPPNAAVFFVPMNTTSKAPAFGEFMIALVPTKHPDMIVFIDPCVENDG